MKIYPYLKMGLRFELQHLPEVVGVGSREETLLVYCATKEVVNKIPVEYQGYPVECVLTGPITSQEE